MQNPVRIAVLSGDIESTLHWIKNLFNLIDPKVILSSRKILDGNREFIIVSNKYHVQGLKFDYYLVAPDYVSLELELRRRCQ